MQNKNLNKATKLQSYKATKSKSKKLIPTFEDFIYEKINQKAIEKENDKLYKKLVGGSGASDTVEGEMLRAINKIIYRYFNDGDYFYKGYGAETAGPAATYFLKSKAINKALQSQIATLLSKAEGANDRKYEDILYEILDLILKKIKSKGKDLTKNKEDIFDFGSNWQDDESYSDDNNDGW